MCIRGLTPPLTQCSVDPFPPWRDVCARTGACLQLFDRRNTGRGYGTVGHLSRNLITRSAYYEHSMVLALMPFQNYTLYGDEYKLL